MIYTYIYLFVIITTRLEVHVNILLCIAIDKQNECPFLFPCIKMLQNVIVTR